MRFLWLKLVCAASLTASACAAPITVHKVSTVPALHPLQLATGGRMLTTPSPDRSFGGTDSTYQWPGSYFRAAFAGTEVFFRIVKGDQILHIVVDGQPAGELTRPSAGVY